MYDCIILAAGASSRMRSPRAVSLGREPLKPLLPFGDSTLVETAVGAALRARCRAILVVGHRAVEVAEPFGSPGYRPAREEEKLESELWVLWPKGLEFDLPPTKELLFFSTS